MTPITKISHQIHKREAILFIINKAEAGDKRYAMAYKDEYYRGIVKVKAKKELLGLRKEREILKLSTPKENWYPKRRVNGGRPKVEHSEVITQIMKEAVQAGFNVKTISAYFNYKLCFVYKRINIKSIERDLKIKKARRIANQNVFS